MPSDLNKLSIAELRRRFVDEGQAVTTTVLNTLKRDPRRGARELHTTLKRRHDQARDERLRLDALQNFERVLWRSGVEHVAGVDEAGVGPLAGPVVAAAVIFPEGTTLAGIDDSKRLAPDPRLDRARAIREAATAWAVAVVEVEEIDRLNIHQAALVAMRRAVAALAVTPEHLLVDARHIPATDIPQNPFQKGDGINFSIAAASILAKTHRDRLMRAYERRFPGYGFARHKGYGTAAHREAIQRLGPCPLHRRSFGVLRELGGEYSGRFYELKARFEACDSARALHVLEQGLKVEALARHEQRKLHLLISRRWKRL